MVKTSQNRNSVKIILDFTGILRLLGNNSVIPFLTAAEKRHFYPPKLPALRAEVDGLAQKSAKPFLLLRRLRLLPLLKPARRRSSSALGIPATLPHGGATSGFGFPVGTRSAVPRKPHKPPTRARQAGIGVLAVRSACVFNETGIFPPCGILVQFPHLPIKVLLEHELN